MYNPQYALLILIMELPGLIELPISTTTLYLTMGRVVLPIIITKRVRSVIQIIHSAKHPPTPPLIFQHALSPAGIAEIH